MFRVVTPHRLGVCALLALGGALCLSIGLRPTVTTVDRNDDGRIDVWEYHDGPFGSVTKIVEDTNFDGRPDRFSYIIGGTLRRESDTNHDGTADLLILYRDGVPVYAKRASPGTLAANVRSQHGNSLIDPFETETTVRCEVRKVDSPAGLMSSSRLYGLAPCRGSPSAGTSVRLLTVRKSTSQFDSAGLVPRGPPASDSALTRSLPTPRPNRELLA
jgi:hypothetical protein